MHCNKEWAIPVKKCSAEKLIFNKDSPEVQEFQILQLGHVHPVSMWNK